MFIGTVKKGKPELRKKGAHSQAGAGAGGRLRRVAAVMQRGSGCLCVSVPCVCTDIAARSYACRRRAAAQDLAPEGWNLHLLRG